MTPAPLFYDRRAAGEQLAKAIAAQISQLDPAEVEKPPIVYALPRGGLPVAEPVARRLGCPLDIMVAKKITRPDNPELAIGAVTADGQVLWVKQRSRRFRFRRLAQAEATAKAQAQEALFASRRPQVQPAGAIALLVDDGIATGMTMAVAAQGLRKQQPAQVWICTPVAPAELMEVLTQWCDRLVVLANPQPFLSVSRFYEQFPQVQIEEAIANLHQQQQWLSGD
ncbi:phosphoribosyltransferase [Phormidium sp. CCY1219]|uniref:phosphoribosyltransferase n=1 Tax=Phormidium sp. CCY1219 TaxID=2886104 RepID=UPI002D1EEF6F|nr:phosphoribosyltransferase family protein [Phormidium sp. CCY1219]MEB3826781.1 phosphoribosyltransferase [Phormidium sp. CCY1219]